MAPHELILGVGRVLRAAADGGQGDEYRRSQLLSAYSVARHLAAEEAASSALLLWLRTALAGALDGDDRPVVAAARDEVAVAASGAQVGDALTPLLASLGPDGADAALREGVHRVLAEMADREVAALAAADE
jgi:hypothetical protein